MTPLNKTSHPRETHSSEYTWGKISTNNAAALNQLDIALHTGIIPKGNRIVGAMFTIFVSQSGAVLNKQTYGAIKFCLEMQQVNAKKEEYPPGVPATLFIDRQILILGFGHPISRRVAIGDIKRNPMDLNGSTQLIQLLAQQAFGISPNLSKNGSKPLSSTTEEEKDPAPETKLEPEDTAEPEVDLKVEVVEPTIKSEEVAAEAIETAITEEAGADKADS